MGKAAWFILGSPSWITLITLLITITKRFIFLLRTYKSHNSMQIIIAITTAGMFPNLHVSYFLMESCGLCCLVNWSWQDSDRFLSYAACSLLHRNESTPIPRTYERSTYRKLFQQKYLFITTSIIFKYTRKVGAINVQLTYPTIIT